MATCKQSAQEMIQDVFSPSVAVLCSSDVDEICGKNNLSFIELVQPFCRLNTELCIRDHSGFSYTIKNLRVVMKNMHFQPPSSAVAKKMMNDAVSNNQLPTTEAILNSKISTGCYDLKFHGSTPWFEAYREVFFQVTYPTEHDFTHHYLACIFVISSSNNDPLSQIEELVQEQIQHQQQGSSHTTRWFFSVIFKYYILLHDVSKEDLTKAENIYQKMKNLYGSTSCHLLQINSGPHAQGDVGVTDPNGSITMPDPWSQFLSKTNCESISESKLSEDSNYTYSHVEESQEQIDGCVSTLSINHPLSSSSDHNSPIGDVLPMLSMDEEESKSTIIGAGNWNKISVQSKKHGICLTLSDMDRIRVFVQEFCMQGLIPFVEKQIRILSEQVANRKGIHRSFINVTKKWFAPNKPGMQGVTTSNMSVVYSQDAPELQVRKLGDLAFMFQLYEVAYQAYHNAKRDFSGDQAWIYFAGAMEMAALSVFMQGPNTQRPYPSHYMETAINTYLNACKIPQFAIRATLLSTECLKSKGMYSESAHQFIHMIGDFDLPSALLLEQASHCYINCKPAKVRKYAFHMILAGHRFSKAGQKKHSLRAYKQAQQVYKDRGWNFANDHINFTIGRQSVHLKSLENGCASLQSLLGDHSQQPAHDQASFLREYIFVLKQLLAEKSKTEVFELPNLPLPLIECQSIKVLMGKSEVPIQEGCLVVSERNFENGDYNNPMWIKLEQEALATAQGSTSMFFNPQLQCFTEKTNNTYRPLSVVGETISVEISLKNPFRIPLVLDNVYLLWNFMKESDSITEEKSITNEVGMDQFEVIESIVRSEILHQLTIEPLQMKKVKLSLTPLHTGTLHIKGVSYALYVQPGQQQQQQQQSNDSSGETLSQKNSILFVQGKQLMDLKGPCNPITKMDNKTYAPDYRLKPVIVKPMPKLQVKLFDFPVALLCGEIVQAVVEFTNIGSQSLQRLLVASPTPEVFSFNLPDYDLDNNNSWLVYKEMSSSGPRQISSHSAVIAECDEIALVKEIFLPDGNPCHLKPGESLRIPLWIRGHDFPGKHNLDFLFYYENSETNPLMRYRLLHYTSSISTYSSVCFQAEAFRSFSFEERSESSQCAADNLVLKLNAENISESQVSDVSLLQVSCISQNWCVSTGCYTHISQASSVIRPKESLHIALKAVSFNSIKTVSSQSAMVFSHVPLGKVEIDSSATPCSDFSIRSRLKSSDLMQEAPESSFSRNEEKKTDDSDSSQLLDITLTLIWKAKIERQGKQALVMGQHHVILEKLASLVSSIPLPMNVEDQPPVRIIPKAETPGPPLIQRTVALSENLTLARQSLKCIISHPSCVQHDFANKKLIFIPVVLIAYNCCQIGLHISIESLKPINESSRQSNLVSHPYTQDELKNFATPGFCWVGPSQREVYINPKSTIHVPLQACFSSPGTYNLGNLNIEIRLRSSENNLGNFAQHNLPPCLIVISSCNVTTY